MNTLYLGRNIGKDNKGYFITFSDKDLVSVYDKRVERSHYATYNKAVKHMMYLINEGSNWFDAHLDPTI